MQPTPSIPPTRINAVEQIETALKTLAAYGYDSVHAVWAEHNAWLASLESRACNDEDRQYATQRPEPTSTLDHFISGQPEILTAAACHVGRQFTLTSGQRDVLRERYGLTPTLVVVAENVELFADEDVIWSLTLRSVEHVDPVRRRHVLNSVVLAPASEFFRVASIKDKEKEDASVERESKSPRVSKSRATALEYT